MTQTPNVKQVVPFFMVHDMERSLRFYMDGLGFEMTYKWTPEGRVQWCWLTLGGASIMLQEYSRKPDARIPTGKLGEGVSLAFICEDAIALYHEFRSRDLEASEPEVGNSMWVTELTDPDGYKIFFESYTDAPEETKLSELSNVPKSPPFEGEVDATSRS